MHRVVFLAVLAATLLPAAARSAETMAEQRVANKIGVHLKQSGQLQNYRVRVKYHEGVAYLDGSVANSEQRDIAVRLSQQVEGVSHVVCKLEIPNESGVTATNAESNTGDDRHELAAALERASFEGAQEDSNNVTHAYQQSGEPQAAPIQQNPMIQRQSARMSAPQMRRSNMPVPAGRIPGMMPMQQGRPSGVNQTSGACSTCNGGGGMGMGPGMGPGMGGPAPTGFVPAGFGHGANTDNPQMPGYAWPSYASYPNYAALSYPQQYSPTAWPYIGPFYPYPQVPLAWRKVSLEWDDGWWFLDFSSHNSSH